MLQQVLWQTSQNALTDSRCTDGLSPTAQDESPGFRALKAIGRLAFVRH